MKKVIILLFSLLLVLSVSGCSQSNITDWESDTTYVVSMDGKTFKVDTQNKTVFDGTHTYNYTASGDSLSYKINIKYPDGSAYYWTQSENMGSGAWSHGYGNGPYADGNVLCNVIAHQIPKGTKPPAASDVLAIISMFVMGGLFAAIPEKMCYKRTPFFGFRYRDPNPSEMSVKITRGTGIVLIIIGILVLIF